MHANIFYYFGKFIYKTRWLLILFWIAVLLACVPFLTQIMEPFKSTGFIDEKSSSTLATETLNKQLGFKNTNKLLIIYTSKTLRATNSQFLNQVKKSLSGLKNFPISHDIFLPDSNNKKQISKDKRSAYAVVIFKTPEPISEQSLAQVKSLIKPPTNMTMQIGGESVFENDLSEQTQVDLFKAEYIATPVSIITLLIVFGSVVAALLPIVLGGGCALIILTTLYFLGHAFTLSVFTINIALLLGLCLSLDYSLFVISRFRHELNNGLPIIEAIAVTQGTAGKAIFFSGLAVFVSLSALLLFPVNILFSVGVGGLAAVLIAVLIAVILLPAILSVLSTKINLLPVRRLQKNKDEKSNFWRWLAEKVVKRPMPFFFSILIVLLMLGYPFLSTKFGVSDYRILPENSKSRQFFDTYNEKFNKNELTPILLLINTYPDSIFTRSNINKLYDLSAKIKKDPRVAQVNSIVSTQPGFTKAQYYYLYKQQRKSNSTLKKFLGTTTRDHFTMMNIVSKHEGNSPDTQNLVTELRDLKNSKAFNLEITGVPVSNMDVLKKVKEILPYALLWIMVFTYLILLILLRSVFLPIKAILMNILSLCASYGVLVFIFQEGHLHELLNFEPQGMLDISLLVIIFCALFGFSMDYEVFLLTRIKEFYEQTGDNDKAIVLGIEQSSKIIISAAIIVVLICCSFMVAHVLMVKAFGLGIAVAIFVDAFLIRTFLVPSTMTLVKKWNWYLPKWLDRILPDL